MSLSSYQRDVTCLAVVQRAQRQHHWEGSSSLAPPVSHHIPAAYLHTAPPVSNSKLGRALQSPPPPAQHLTYQAVPLDQEPLLIQAKQAYAGGSTSMLTTVDIMSPDAQVVNVRPRSHTNLLQELCCVYDLSPPSLLFCNSHVLCAYDNRYHKATFQSMPALTKVCSSQSRFAVCWAYPTSYQQSSSQIVNKHSSCETLLIQPVFTGLWG